MGRNLKYQLKTTIEKNFKSGVNKHSLKINNGKDKARIYSYAGRRNLINFTANLANWMNLNYPGIKLAKEIKSEHIQKFLNDKANECSQATIEQYVSLANKTQHLINTTYGCNNKLDIKAPKSDSGKQILRDKQMELKDYTKIHSVMQSGGNGQKAIEIGKNFGLRVSEIVKLQKRDIDLKNKEIRVIDGKGGRDRTVVLRTDEQFRVATRLYNSVERQMDRIVPVKANTVNMALNRAMQKLGIKNNYKETSFHSLRKLYAQEEFDRLRANGYSIQESCGEVSMQLGHSKERGQDKDLINRYIKNIE